MGRWKGGEGETWRGGGRVWSDGVVGDVYIDTYMYKLYAWKIVKSRNCS